MAKYRCDVCYFVYDEEKEGLKWEDLHDGWVCPVCDSPQSVFTLFEEKTKAAEKTGKEEIPPDEDGIETRDDIDGAKLDPGTWRLKVSQPSCPSK